jgi:twitching motility two-component system response regulator PilH
MEPKKTILIIDDEPDAVAYMKEVLEDGGYETITAPDGEQGLQKARQNPPDLILLDLMMPKMSGMKFLNEIRQDEHLKKVPIVVESGARQATGVDMKQYLHDQPHKEKKAAATGVDVDIDPAAFIEKPISPAELLSTVSKFL